MSIYTSDKQTNADLVATVLGKKVTDDECIRLGQCIANEGTFTDMLYFQSSSARQSRLARIQASVELGRRALMAQHKPKEIVTTPEDVTNLMAPIFSGLEHEVFYALMLDSKNKLKKMVEVSIGSLNASIVHPRELFKQAVILSAASIVVVHNHPSGDPTPSHADLQLTRRLVKAGEVLGIEILDHVVIGGEGRCVSMREQGVL